MGTDKDIHPHELLKFNDKMGIEAKVERKQESNENTKRANMALGDIGNFIKQDCGIGGMQELVYVGSMAVHIYQAVALGTFQFVSQTAPLADADERTVDSAFRQLRGDMANTYGRRRDQKRSGV